MERVSLIVWLAALAFITTLPVILGGLIKDDPSPAAPVETLSEAQRFRIAGMAKAWDAAPAFGDPFYALDPLRKAAADDGRAKYNPADDYWGLPRVGAYELVDIYCTGCHSAQLIMQQRASPGRWDYMLKWMITEQNMEPMDPADAPSVRDYLVTHFGSGD